MTNKKRIGFNALDLVIVVVLALCVAMIGFRFIRTSEISANTESVKYRVNFLITNVSDGSREALVAGDSVFSQLNDAYIGKLVAGTKRNAITFTRTVGDVIIDGSALAL